MVTTHVAKLKNGRLSKKDLSICVETIQSGGVLIFPTDTVYGLGANAFKPEAIRRIYSLKGRHYSKPLPVLLPDANQLKLVAEAPPQEADKLINSLWPGPLTLVVKTASMALHVTHGRKTIAVRVPDHGVARTLLNATQVPLAATSVNKSGEKSLTTGAQVKKEFLGRVDVIIDGGSCPIGRESSVVDATHYPFTVLRQGAVSKEELLTCIQR